MKIIKVNDYEELNQVAASMIIDKVHASSDITIGLATGGTPLGTYQKIIEDYNTNQTSYKHVKSFNLDEYVGLPATDSNSYRYYMDENLFKHIDIDPSNIHIPNGTAEDIQKECQDYEAKIDAQGIDLQILGIGLNGHIGFNEPGTSFESNTHPVTLTSSTREANARFFQSLDAVPKQAITMGIASILKSKEILLLAHGKEKSEAIAKLLYGSIDENFPASVLKNHPNVTIIADSLALSSLNDENGKENEKEEYVNR